MVTFNSLISFIYTPVKHLKLFESSDPYYTPISMNDYDDYDYKEYLRFDDPEIKKLESLFGKWRSHRLYPESHTRRSNNGICFVYAGMSVVIRKLEDEWYLISENSVLSFSIYKCDQWEGLLKCLKEKILFQI